MRDPLRQTGTRTPAGSGEMTPSSGQTPSDMPTRLATASPSFASSVIGTGPNHGRFLPGAMLGDRYRIVGLLGRGGMGEVYRADDLRLGQPVALKFLPDQIQHDPDRLARFHNEVRVARSVSHPNVCRVYDIGEIDGSVFLTMEYVDGEDLASLLRRIGRLPKDKAIEIARQLCYGLAAAHDRGVLHRDLKPLNVMIDGRGVARITDFGLAALADELDVTDVRVGTPAFMAPEQLVGQAVTLKSDVYSLGLVLYELFTGKRAFTARDFDHATHLHTETTPASPSSLVDDFDPVIERLILRCLAKDPVERPESARSVARALPGGDPLAAALEAGETPAPELVAAAGVSGGLRPLIGFTCLGVIVVALTAFLILAKTGNAAVMAALEKRPEVLADRAAELVQRVAPMAANADSAYGFRLDHAYLQHARDNAAKQPNTPQVAQFWYRQSPRPLVPEEVTGVKWDDPPVLVGGMINVRLDPRGRLLEFRRVPAQRAPNRAAAADDSSPTDDAEPADAAPTSLPSLTALPAAPLSFDEGGSGWQVLLREAGLDPRRLRTDTPAWLPPDYADLRLAWIGSSPESPDQELRVEAAALAGEPTWFRVLSPWEATPVAPTAASSDPSQIAPVVLSVLLIVGAMLLARRNARLGRSNTRGATLIASFAWIGLMLSWSLQAHHVLSPEEWNYIVMAAGRFLVVSGILWLCYVALEPYVRRRWPDCLIAWSRLLSGRVSDPLVGRELLVGVTGGCLVAVFHMVYRYLESGAGPSTSNTALALHTLVGLRHGLGTLIQVAFVSVYSPMIIATLLVLMVLVFRHRVAAMIAFFVLMNGFLYLMTPDAPAWLQAVSVAGNSFVILMWLIMLTRVGLLAMMALTFAAQTLTAFPTAPSLDVWYLPIAALALLAVLGVAIGGFYLALAGRPVFNHRLLDA